MKVVEVAPRFWPLVTGRDGLAKRKLALAFLVTIVTIGPVLGQAPPVPLEQLPPTNSPIERLTPRQLPPVSPGSMNLGRTDDSEVPNIPINVRQVDLRGADLFGAEFRPGLQGLRGPATSLEDLNKARQGILMYYRTRGYPLVAVSLDVDRANGFVTYHVTEGRIVDVEAGRRYRSGR